jgi:EAL domain-containing protein (putative c-di-GMP-specific phosphodiesterase class I)
MGSVLCQNGQLAHRGKSEIFSLCRGGTRLADAKLNIGEKIAKQIAQIAKESVEIDIEVIQFLKEDLEEIRNIAKEKNISSKKLVLQILEGVKDGLVESGKITVEEIRKILGRSEEELHDLQEK